MNRRDWIPSAFLLVLSIVAVTQSLRLPLSAEYGPGPGFLPLLLGLAMGILCVVHMSQCIRSKAPSKTLFQNPSGAKKAAGVAALFLAYIVLLPYIGLLIGLALFLVILIWLVEKQSIFTALACALGGSLSCYFLFEVWLKVPLPIGVFGLQEV